MISKVRKILHHHSSLAYNFVNSVIVSHCLKVSLFDQVNIGLHLAPALVQRMYKPMLPFHTQRQATALQISPYSTTPTTMCP